MCPGLRNNEFTYHALVKSPSISMYFLVYSLLAYGANYWTVPIIKQKMDENSRAHKSFCVKRRNIWWSLGEMNAWMDEWVSEWVSEWVNEWMN